MKKLGLIGYYDFTKAAFLAGIVSVLTSASSFAVDIDFNSQIKPITIAFITSFCASLVRALSTNSNGILFTKDPKEETTTENNINP